MRRRTVSAPHAVPAPRRAAPGPPAGINGLCAHDLYDLARARGVRGRSLMTRSELLEALGAGG